MRYSNLKSVPQIILPVLLAVLFTAADKPKPIERLIRSDKEWKKILTPEQFEVMRKNGTERACTGIYWKNKEKGVYHCSACDLELFESKTKYESETGWASFWAPVSPRHVVESTDKSHGMTRTEVRCARCDSHLGHVFPDGPKPTGLRYCLNSVALKFVPDEKK